MEKRRVSVSYLQRVSDFLSFSSDTLSPCQNLNSVTYWRNEAESALLLLPDSL